jgi:hypothetical protein
MDRQLTPLDFISTTTPGIPASGFVRVYARPDGKLYASNDQGTEFDLTALGGGGSSDLVEATVDPVTPRAGEQWLLKTITEAQPIPSGVLLGGFMLGQPRKTGPMIDATAGPTITFDYSVNTSNGIKRMRLQ